MSKEYTPEHWKAIEFEMYLNGYYDVKDEDKLQDGVEVGDIKTEAIYQDVVDTESPLTPEGIMYDRITVLLTAKVQSQQKEIEYLKDQIELIKSSLNLK